MRPRNQHTHTHRKTCEESEGTQEPNKVKLVKSLSVRSSKPGHMEGRISQIYYGQIWL